jgi:hypothetical protein
MTRLLKTKKDKIEFMTWVSFLQLQIFPKGTGCMEGFDGMCCLGVGCAVTIDNPKTYKASINGRVYISGGYPLSQPEAPRWLKRINQNFYNRTKRYLSSMNDGGVSHPEIARKLLEVYGHEL